MMPVLPFVKKIRKFCSIPKSRRIFSVAEWSRYQLPRSNKIISILEALDSDAFREKDIANNSIEPFGIIFHHVNFTYFA